MKRALSDLLPHWPDPLSVIRRNSPLLVALLIISSPSLQAKNKLNDNAESALDHTVSGQPKVNVLVKDTVNGNTPDVDGKYKITVTNGDAVLVFSFIGQERILRQIRCQRYSTDSSWEQKKVDRHMLFNDSRESVLARVRNNSIEYK